MRLAEQRREKKTQQAGGRVLFQEGRCDGAFVRLERHGRVLFSADAQDKTNSQAWTAEGREEERGAGMSPQSHDSRTGNAQGPRLLGSSEWQNLGRNWRP